MLLRPLVELFRLLHGAFQKTGVLSVVILVLCCLKRVFGALDFRKLQITRAFTDFPQLREVDEVSWKTRLSFFVNGRLTRVDDAEPYFTYDVRIL